MIEQELYDLIYGILSKYTKVEHVLPRQPRKFPYAHIGDSITTFGQDTKDKLMGYVTVSIDMFYDSENRFTLSKNIKLVYNELMDMFGRSGNTKYRVDLTTTTISTQELTTDSETVWNGTISLTVNYKQ